MRLPACGTQAGTRRVGFTTFLVAVISAAVGCVTPVPGDRLCADPPSCECPAATDHGAVIVRWRVSDGQAGQLLGRGECCCIPPTMDPSPTARAQCPSFGISCPTSPPWLIRNVQLRITSVDDGHVCIISKPCTDAELTTEYCLAEGLYDMQVTADVDVYDKSCEEFVCANRPANSPPAVRRRVIGGRAVNLDGIVLGVNPPPISGNSDGGTSPGLCSAPTDGGTHE